MENKQPKQPLQIRIADARKELEDVFTKFKGAIPFDFEKSIEKHLAKLYLISDDLKEIQTDECPTWFTREVYEEFLRLWNLMDADNKRYTHRLEAFKMVQRAGEEAGYKVTLTKFDELRKKYC